MTFVGVALLSALALAGLAAGLPRAIGRGLPMATLGERLRVIRRPQVATTLLSTTVWAVGSYAVYTFIAPLLASATPLGGARIGYALFLWGSAAGVGLMLGGSATDRLGGRVVVRASLGALVLALAALSALTQVLPPATALVPVLLAMTVWGLSAWAFYPAQQGS